MLTRDYISRIIRTFFQALELLFTGKKEDEEEQEKKLEELYLTYFEKSRQDFLTEKAEDMMVYLKEDPYYLEKCGMLGEVLYREFHGAEDPALKENLARKVIYLYDYVNNHSADYSLIYVNRTLELEDYLREVAGQQKAE